MASDYGNLGQIYAKRGDLDRAEEMFRKSLAIQEKLRCLQDMPINYSNLGVIYERRGDPAEARRFWTKARDIYARLGNPSMRDKIQGWIDGLDSPSPGE